MRAVIAAVLLSLSCRVAALDVRFDPVAPTSHSFVKLHVSGVAPDACTPRDAVVTRNGNVFSVTLKRPEDCGGISVPTPWNHAVPLGVLEPGVYEVHSSADFETSRRETLVIRDGDPPFHVSPATVRVAGGDTIAIWRVQSDPEPGPCPFPTAVSIAGIDATLVQADCGLVFVRVPPHAAGAVDVIVRFSGSSVTAPVALQYVDPASAPDESSFERLLVPVLYDGPGAYGSQWVSEGELRPVESSEPLRWMHDVVNAECASGACSGEVVNLASFGDHPAGLLLFVPRDLGYVDAALYARDTSRDDTSWGVQIPIVREKDFVRERSMVFRDLPFDSRYRMLLRIYGVDGASSHVRVSAGTKSHVVTLHGTCGFYATPCNTARPAFAAIDLLQLFPELAGRGRFTVTVSPTVETSLRYWSFVSITNNETQYATVMTP